MELYNSIYLKDNCGMRQYQLYISKIIVEGDSKKII